MGGQGFGVAENTMMARKRLESEYPMFTEVMVEGGELSVKEC